MFELLVMGFVSGIVTAGILIAYLHYKNYRRLMMMKYYAESLLEEFEEKVIKARIEFDYGNLMCYNSETGEFLAQAKNWNELNERLKERFPDKMFDVPQDQITRAQSYDQ